MPMKTLGRNWPWLLLSLAVAVATHLGIVYALPHVVMNRALARLGSPNAIHHGRRANAHSHVVVRPSPDMLYSVCPYDLSRGPLHVTAPVPADTYWSVSAYDADTDNFFVENDRQAHGAVDFLIVSKQAAHPHAAGLPVVVSPSMRGIVLFRTLINDDAQFARLDKERRAARCKTYSEEGKKG